MSLSAFSAHITFSYFSDPLVQSYMELETEHVEMTLPWDRLWQQLNDISLSAKSVF